MSFRPNTCLCFSSRSVFDIPFFTCSSTDAGLRPNILYRFFILIFISLMVHAFPVLLQAITKSLRYSIKYNCQCHNSQTVHHPKGQILIRDRAQYGHAESCHTDHRSDYYHCLLYTSPRPRDATLSRMPSSA